MSPENGPVPVNKFLLDPDPGAYYSIAKRTSGVVTLCVGAIQIHYFSCNKSYGSPTLLKVSNQRPS
jgi:hypothetical protein